MVLMYFDKCTCTNKRKNGWDKRRICNLLEKNTNQIAKSDIKIILGDFNEKADKEIIYKLTNGNESLHKETNNSGIKIIQLAVSNV